MDLHIYGGTSVSAPTEIVEIFVNYVVFNKTLNLALSEIYSSVFKFLLVLMFTCSNCDPT